MAEPLDQPRSRTADALLTVLSSALLSERSRIRPLEEVNAAGSDQPGIFAQRRTDPLRGSAPELHVKRRRLRVGVASAFLSIAGLAGMAMLVLLSELKGGSEDEKEIPQAATVSDWKIRGYLPRRAPRRA